MSQSPGPDIEDPEEAQRSEIENYDPRQRGRAIAFDIWQSDDLGYDLTVDEQLFVRSYVVDRNEMAALARLGYDVSTDRQRCKRIAERYLRNVSVQDAIAKLTKSMMDRLEITAERVQREIGNIAFTNVTDVMRFDAHSQELLPSHLWPEHAKTAVKSVSQGQFGLKVEFHDKKPALDFLAKTTGLTSGEENAEAERMAAAAAAAMTKIMTVVGRSRELKHAKVLENKSDD